MYIECKNSESIKTRIETLYCRYVTLRTEAVRIVNPLKQGLKRICLCLYEKIN
ncbi:collagenase-like protease [Leptotrichia hofstadii]|uniref:Collagenase-like protease n=1 Tax=Leptotrichia hofstadii TaxID=157688 RepID=A0A510JJ90_9FUSO|nr:collagenase-like protease [Leptotrichia hofstadii]